MLDDATLTAKLLVARDWFRRSRAGEFEFTGRHADKFEELLEFAERHARRLERDTSHDEPGAADEGDNVVRLLDRRKGTATGGER